MLKTLEFLRLAEYGCKGIAVESIFGGKESLCHRWRMYCCLTHGYGSLGAFYSSNLEAREWTQLQGESDLTLNQLVCMEWIKHDICLSYTVFTAKSHKLSRVNLIGDLTLKRLSCRDWIKYGWKSKKLVGDWDKWTQGQWESDLTLNQLACI